MCKCDGCQVEINYTANTITLSIFFGGTQAQFVIQRIVRWALVAPVIVSAAIYYTDSIFFKNDSLDGWS